MVAYVCGRKFGIAETASKTLPKAYTHDRIAIVLQVIEQVN